MKKTEQKVIKFIDSQGLIKAGDKVLIALSGGPDSVFLLHFLHKYKKRFKIDLHAVHVNHQLRDADAEKDEAFCRKLCDDMAITFYAEKVDVKKYARQNKLSVEEVARKLRYGILEKTAQQIKANKIATAHNSSDNAETVLLNLFHGTGLSGIAGIPVVRGNIIRPILSLTKDEITNYLNSAGLKFRIDKSNKDENFRRNFIRRKIIPLIKKNINPSVENTLLKSSEVLRNSNNILNDHLLKLLKKYASYSNGVLQVELKILEKYPIEILGDILKRLLTEKFNHEFSYNDFTKITGLVAKQPGRREMLTGKLVAYRERDKILIQRESDDGFTSVKVAVGSSVKTHNGEIGIDNVKGKPVFSPSKLEEVIAADGLDDNFVIRRWKAGDKFKPLGMQNFKLVSDFLNEQKIPSSQKKNQLVLVNRNNIVWIIGLRIDERVKIKSETKKIWRVWSK